MTPASVKLSAHLSCVVILPRAALLPRVGFVPTLFQNECIDAVPALPVTDQIDRWFDLSGVLLPYDCQQKKVRTMMHIFRGADDALPLPGLTLTG